MSISPSLTVSTGLLLTGASLFVGLLGVAWQLGAVATAAHRFADNAETLSRQLQTITDGIDS